MILRTSWVMGPVGKNFAHTMLRLFRARKQIGVVEGQVGCPLPAQRPSYPLLDCSATRQALGLLAVHWRQALRQLLEGVA